MIIHQIRAAGNLWFEPDRPSPHAPLHIGCPARWILLLVASADSTPYDGVIA
jgi:hypothetical protein